jgi:hypothetical protein
VCAFVLFINCPHLCPHSLDFCITWHLAVFFVVFVEMVEVHWNELHGRDVLLIVSHGETGIVGLDALQLVLQDVTAAMAADDATGLPEAYLVEEFVAADANLANEQLVDVVGG